MPSGWEAIADRIEAIARLVCSDGLEGIARQSDASKSWQSKREESRTLAMVRTQAAMEK